MLDNNKRPAKRARSKGASDHVIGVGSRVSVRDLRSGELDIYTLVLPADADISRHQISTFTPLGGAIMGHRSGDVVEFQAPAGRVKVRIESAQEAPVADPTGQLP